MKKILMPILKYCKPIYGLYYYLGTWSLNFLKLFLKTDERLILFNSFGGKKFDDSPKALYDAMIERAEFAGYDLVWAFQEPEKFSLPVGRKIKTDTLTYFITALKARCWITNSSMERGLGFTGKHTFFLNTWHGTPIKKMGSDLKKGNTSFKSKNTWNMDVMTAQSRYEAEIFTRVFALKKDICRICGLPRNDVLTNGGAQQQMSFRKKLGIAQEKTIILYAPTFREYEKNENMQCVFHPPINWELWKKELGDSYCILLRAHYEEIQSMQVEQYTDFLMDVSDYPSLNELMVASDFLISDYSSILFDYAILRRPMLCFAYDYEEYEASRGMYIDIRKWLPGGMITQEQLLQLILDIRDEKEYKKAVKMTENFRKQFVECYGNGTENVLDIIVKAIQ